MVGQGYPHDRNNLGPTNSGGATIVYENAGYICELVAKLDAGELPPGEIYTASVHLRDQPALPGVASTLEGLAATLDASTSPRSASSPRG